MPLNFLLSTSTIAFAFKYGMEIMTQTGISTNVIRAGKANLFLSPLFRDTLASTANAAIELFNTDGSVGAARGAGLGCGIYKNEQEAFANLKKVGQTDPDTKNQAKYQDAYALWKEKLETLLK